MHSHYHYKSIGDISGLCGRLGPALMPCTKNLPGQYCVPHFLLSPHQTRASFGQTEPWRRRKRGPHQRRDPHYTVPISSGCSAPGHCPKGELTDHRGELVPIPLYTSLSPWRLRGRCCLAEFPSTTWSFRACCD
jgi:hypothetical protein